MPKIFHHNALVLASRIDALYNRFDWTMNNTHRYSIFFDKVATIIDNTEQMQDFNSLLRVWEYNYGIPIKVFESYLQQISFAFYQGGRLAKRKLVRKIETTDARGFPIIRQVSIDWYEAQITLDRIVNWCYAMLNKMAYEYDLDTNTIFNKDLN